jgi:hypothetical protein
MSINKSFIILFLSFVSLQILESCKHIPNEVVPNITIVNDTVVYDSICFERDILPIFKSNCAIEACHDAITGQEGIVFDSYNTFFLKGFVPGDAANSQVFNSITRTTSRRMPPLPKEPLDSNQIALIKKWINQGMKENTCKELIDTNQFAYRENIYPIIKNYCYGCHNDLAEHPNGIKLENYNQIKTYAINGQLLGSIKHANGYKAMPENGLKMDEKLIQKIEKWILNGAPNN